MILLVLCVCLAVVLHQPGVQGSLTLDSLMTTNEEQQKAIVDKHNDLRRQVIPTASNMLRVEWDPEAAKNAQKWANKCLLQHSLKTDRTINITGDSVNCGENLFMSSTPWPWPDAIQPWFDEVKSFEFGVGAKEPEAVIGHYTQVVWYSTYKLGCAVAYCPNQTMFKWLYVCQYCPAGNVKGRISTPYSKGKPCEACPDACDNGLCTNPCPKRNWFANCLDLKKTWGCNLDFMKDCSASCQCTKEIY